MGKYPIRLIGTPVVPGDLDYDMDPPEWHTPWFEADALDADGHHHRIYWPIPNKTNEWLVGHLLTVDDRVISVMSEAQAKEWARDQLYPRDYDALCDGLWWCPV